MRSSRQPRWVSSEWVVQAPADHLGKKKPLVAVPQCHGFIHLLRWGMVLFQGHGITSVLNHNETHYI